jgi:Bbp16-like protein
MLLDKNLLMSDRQALAASGNSTDVIDFGSARSVGSGTPAALVCILNAKGANSDNTFRAVLVGADDSAFTVNKITIADSGVQTNPPVGPVYMAVPAHQPKRYLRVEYTVAGTGVAYVVTAGLAMGEQTAGIIG